MKIRSTLAVTAYLLCFAATHSHSTHLVGAEQAKSDPAVYRYHSLSVALRSWHPDEPLKTYREHGSGTCSGGGTTGLGVGGKRHFNVTVRCLPKREQILAEIKVKAYGGDDQTKDLEVEIDLSDLLVDRIELAQDDDGRIYHLIVRPEILEAKMPRAFDTASLKLLDWDFQSSPVILNDESYVGQIGMSGGTLAGIEIAGIAKLEFSLLPLKDGKPIGTLNDGTIRISGEKMSIMIAGVRNGAKPHTLSDGPYRVWVRWLPPSVPQDKVHELVREQLEVIKKLKAEGNSIITDDIIKRLQKFADSGKPILLGSSARDVRKDELD